MKKIVILRHAKSSWDNPALDDHDRPLNGRGTSAAPVIGEWLKSRNHLPDAVLCSSSKRTLQTVNGIRSVIPRLPKPEVERALYHASPEELRARLTALPKNVHTVMVVGHQPGLGSLVRKLSNGHEQRRCKRAYEHFPTAAAAVLEIDLEDWSELDFETARFVDFAKPRELMDA